MVSLLFSPKCCSHNPKTMISQIAYILRVIPTKKHSIWHIFWHSIWHIFWLFYGKTFWRGRGGEDDSDEIWISSESSSPPLSPGILSGKSSDILSGVLYISAISYIFENSLIYGWGPAGTTLILCLRSSACSWGPAEAKEQEEEAAGGGGTADIKSNNPHLTGGEWMGDNHPQLPALSWGNMFFISLDNSLRLGNLYNNKTQTHDLTSHILTHTPSHHHLKECSI